MSKLFLQLLRDEAGFVLSAELILIATITVIGLVVGLSEVSSAVNNELGDLGNAFNSLNTSYRYGSMSGNKGTVPASAYQDNQDGSSDIAGAAAQPES